MYKIIDVLAYFHYLCFLRGKPNACFTGKNLHEFFKSEGVDVSKDDLSLILRNFGDSRLLNWTEHSPVIYIVDPAVDKYPPEIKSSDFEKVREISRRFYNYQGCDFEGKRFIDGV